MYSSYKLLEQTAQTESKRSESFDMIGGCNGQEAPPPSFEFFKTIVLFRAFISHVIF